MKHGEGLKYGEGLKEYLVCFDFSLKKLTFSKTSLTDIKWDLFVFYRFSNPVYI